MSDIEYIIPDSWNEFIDKIVSVELDKLNHIQKNSVLAFWYHAEMNSAGHEGYFSRFPETDPQELCDALMAIGVPDVAENYKAAVALEGEGIDDGYLVTDDIFYDLEQGFFEKMLDYVEAHKTELGV